MLIVCFFTIGCQSTPENAVVINKNEGVLESKIEQEVSPNQLFDIPGSIKENVYGSEGKYSINIDASVEKIKLSEYPVYLITCNDFKQTEVDMVIKYFFKDSPLYDQNYIRSKSMILDRIVQVKAEIHNMSGEDSDDLEAAQNELNNLEREYKTAPDTAQRTQITSTLTIPSDADYESLKACADLGYKDLSTIHVSNRLKFQSIHIMVDKSRYYISSALLIDKNPEGQEMTREEAKNKAEEALDAMGIENMTAINVQTGITEDQKKQGYVVTFRRSVNGLPIALNTILNYSEKQDMSAKWRSDLITVRLDDNGISDFSWSDKGEIQKELTSDVELLTFENIIDIARQQLKNKFSWIETNNNNSFHNIHVDRIVLEYTCIQQKDNADNYLLVPTWNFYGGIQDKNVNGITREQTGLRKDICVLSINAIDGSVIG